MILNMAKDLLDPRTKQATAFYAALGITLWDIHIKGFQPLSAAMLAGMAGIGILGGLSVIRSKVQAQPGKEPPPE